MKANLFGVDGKKVKQIEIPDFFKEAIRVDLIKKISELMKRKQPYGPSPVAGNQHSASGKLKHHRHVWKSQYGRGMSRIPRMQRSRKGSQFDWVGATVPSARGGRRAHPPKVISMVTEGKINKKELKLATLSAISATASQKYLTKRYSTLKGEIKIELPFLVDSKIIELKTKKLLETLKAVLGTKLYSIAIQKKEIRKGRGKIRGRKYKSNLGLLLVLGNGEKIKTTAFDTINVKELSVNHLAKGEPGRLTVYTEKAILDLKERFSGKKEKILIEKISKTKSKKETKK
jgi:large subunit ribosomal protein L4e